MHIFVTGGAGFLGVRLARTLLSKVGLTRSGSADCLPVSAITLTDRFEPPADLLADPRIRYAPGDLNDLLAAGTLIATDVAVVFHLAAAVSGECEADFDLGLRSNLDATRALLEACRALGTKPTFVFASSLAVFGVPPGSLAPEKVDDTSLPTPQSSYGIQKFICEQLVADYGRKGFLRARNVRLMTVSVRPGKPNGAASSFLSGMIREPLAGVRAVVPVPPETRVALSSPERTIEGLVRAAEADDGAWGPLTAMNFPSLSVTVREMADALGRVGGTAAVELLDWAPDPAIEKVVKTWPGVVLSPRAHALGLHAEPDFETLIHAYLRDNPAE